MENGEKNLEEEIKTASFYPSDLVNTIPRRFASRYISTTPSGVVVYY